MTVLSPLQASLHRRLCASPLELDALVHAFLDEEEGRPEAYRDLLWVLGNVQVDAPEAPGYFDRVQEHRASMETALGHAVDFRVSLMDYFFHVQPRYESPKIIEFREYQENLSMAMEDSLTGLMNRRSMETFLRGETARSLRHGLELSLIFLDLDDFKVVNDSRGHHVGDMLLSGFADFLRSQIRNEDMAGRWGGEEFILALPATGRDGAVKLARRLLRGVHHHRFVQSLKVTFSAGLACIPSEVSDLSRAIALADERMYKAKGNGKNQICAVS